MSHPELNSSTVARPLHRQFAGSLIIVVAVGIALGATLKTNVLIGANDISRWCTVWSLLERGTYQIDECPWQIQTQDKVWMKDPFPKPGEEARKHFYSSKPPLLPTLIAGLLYPVRALTGVPLDTTVEQARSQRLEVQSLDYEPKENQRVVETTEFYKIIDITPKDPAKWPSQALYFDPVLILLNIVPMAVFLVLFSRWLDRHAAHDWAWLFSLTAAGFGTNLFLFSPTLNNHTIAAHSAFFAAYSWLRIWTDGERGLGYFAAVGFFSAFAACVEYPAVALAAMMTLSLLWLDWRKTLAVLIPAALVPAIAHGVSLYLATGGEIAYSRFLDEGPDAPYRYPGSYWLSPLGADALDEPVWVYAFHLTLGHHGIFSLTPVFLYAFWGLFSLFSRRGARLRLFGPAVAVLLLSVLVFCFYLFNPQKNYGGSTQGARWLFWLFPLWLIFLPYGVEGGQANRWLRRLALLALFLSAMNSGYGILSPWSHPYLMDWIEHLGLYETKR
jgi:hypothetical protein